MLQCRSKVASRRKVACVVRPLVNVRGLELKCTRLFHNAPLVLVLLYGSEAMIWREKLGFITFFWGGDE